MLCLEDIGMKGQMKKVKGFIFQVEFSLTGLVFPFLQAHDSQMEASAAMHLFPVYLY